MIGRTGLLIGELTTFPFVVGKAVCSLGSDITEPPRGLPGREENEAGGNMVVKLGTPVGLDGGELGLETEGWGRGLLGGLSAGPELKKGPSKAFAGEGDRLPGIVAKVVFFVRAGLE